MCKEKIFESEIYYLKNGKPIKYDKKDGKLENILNNNKKDRRTSKMTLEDFDNVNITMENEHIFQDLLFAEFGNPWDPNTKLYDGDDEYEKTHLVYEKLYPLMMDPQPYEIWFCDYPFRNFNDTYKKRPCLIWPIDSTLYGIMLSSYEKEKVSKVKKSKLPYVKILQDWNSH